MAGQITCLLKREATGANHSQTGSQKAERPTLQGTSFGAGLPQRRETDPPASQNWVKPITINSAKNVEALLGLLGRAAKRKPGSMEGNAPKDLRQPNSRKRSSSTQEDPDSSQCRGSTRIASYQARRVGSLSPLASVSSVQASSTSHLMLSDKGQLLHTGPVLETVV